MIIRNSSPHLQHTISNNQRVFVVGDIEGELTPLKKQLALVSFDPTVDILYCLGDYMDRGEDHTHVWTFLKEIGAICLMGNHEWLMAKAVLDDDSSAQLTWYRNGGKWHIDHDEHDLITLAQEVSQLPFSITLEYQGCKIGLSHTIPPQWDWENQSVEINAMVNNLLWDRTLVKTRKLIKNDHVDFSIHGHNTSQMPFWIGNSYHINTIYYGRHTLVDLSQCIARHKARLLKRNIK
jgi:serine/threonine protein phosphatase 1